MKLFRILVVSMAFAGLTLAQKWEFGGGVGTGFYTSKDVTSPAGTASARIRSNISGSAWVGNNKGGRWGGELRYDYQRGALGLKQGSTEATFGGESHAMHYDILLQGASGEARVRPFVAFGGGIKIYRGTGTESVTQPLSKIALLTKAQDLQPMASIGAGFKVALSPRVQLRLEVHDYLSPFPKEVITPAANGSVGSMWINDIVPMVAIAFTN